MKKRMIRILFPNPNNTYALIGITFFTGMDQKTAVVTTRHVSLEEVKAAGIDVRTHKGLAPKENKGNKKHFSNTRNVKAKGSKCRFKKRHQ